MTFFLYISTHWKSTANGLLALFITTGTVLLATGNTPLGARTTLYITIALALARAYVGLLEKDPDKITVSDVNKATVEVAKIAIIPKA